MSERLVDVVVGEQRGDEGKGRVVDMLAGAYDIVARFNGGNNAGHTIVSEDGAVLKLNTIPSGITRENVVNVVGAGVLVNPVSVDREIEQITSAGIEVDKRNLLISSAAHLIMPHHVSLDEIRETGENKQGSTKRGISPAASDKAARLGIRVEMINDHIDMLEDLAYAGLEKHVRLRREAGIEEPFSIKETVEKFIDSAKKIGKYTADTTLYLNKQLRKDRPAHVLAESAQGFLLDVDHGMYPETSSTGSTSGAVPKGLGISPRFIGRVTGVAKAIQSHVGNGKFVTEIDPSSNLYDRLHGDLSAIDAETGTNTNRVRRLGYFDIAQLRRAQLVNGTTEMIINKVDWLNRYGDEIKICTAYEREGELLDIAPGSAQELTQCAPVYTSLPGWEEDISEVKSFGDLPVNAQKYIDFIEHETKVPITMIGVGPRRDQVIVRAS